MNPPPQLMIAGDIHGDTSHAIYLLRTAMDRGITRIVQVGDFGAWEHEQSGVQYFNDVNKHAKNAGITVYWLDGNHDKSSLVLAKYGQHRDEEGFVVCRDRVRYAPRGHRWTWNGVRFLAFGGAYSVDKFQRLDQEHEKYTKMRERREKYGSSVDPDSAHGKYWFPEEEATPAQVALVLADPSPVDVLLTHDKPHLSFPKGWGYQQPRECLPNQRAISSIANAVQPTLHIHGHLHYPYTHRVPLAGGTTMTVIGLDCNVAGFHPGYNPADSWMILDLQPLGVGEQFPPSSRPAPWNLTPFTDQQENAAALAWLDQLWADKEEAQ